MANLDQAKYKELDPFSLEVTSGGTLEVARGPAIALATLTADDYDLDKGAGHVIAG